jgi:hypothetical protein
MALLTFDIAGEFAGPSDVWSATSATTPVGAAVPFESPGFGLQTSIHLRISTA